MELAEIMLAEDDVLNNWTKSDFRQSYYWVMLDNFRLEYLGFDADEVVALAQQQITAARGLLDGKMQNVVRGNLTSALDQIGDVLDAEPLDLTNLYEAYDQLLVTTGGSRSIRACI